MCNRINRKVFLRSHPSSRSLTFFFIFLGFLGSSPAIDAAPSVKKIAAHTVPYAKAPSAESHRLTKDASNGIVSFFDAQNRLVQERYSYKTKDQCNLRVILPNPRVQLIDCPRPQGARLEGFDSLGQPQWSYEIRGEKKVVQEEVFGGSREGIVLSGLKVIDPEIGKVILKPPAKSAFQPRLTVTRSILYIPSSETFYYYDAEVSLFRKKGGMFRIRPPYQTEEKLLSLKWGLLGHVSIDAMVMSRDKRYLFLGKRWDTRGAGWVEFAVFDLKEAGGIFSDRAEESCICHNLKIAVGMKGKVAFSYDQTAVTKAVVYQVDGSLLKEKLP
jgi:hypothetical protein